MTTGSLSHPRRVVVAEPFAEIGLDVLRAAGIEIDSFVGKPRQALIDGLSTADGLIVRSETRVDKEMLAAGPKLSVVARAGVGVDAIDVDAATAAGIIVVNAPGANTLSAVEQTFALMLSLARFTPQAVQSLREGRWDRKPFIGTELYGKTLGIVGLGRIGGNVATRAKAFGMKLLATDPFISQSRADAFSCALLPLEELLAKADFVTLHVPLNAQTRGMIAASHLARMRPHAHIINCARGGVIVEADLLAALDANQIAGAGIDVVAVEPPPADGTGARLHKHPKVIATPHLGGSTHEALERIATEIAHDVARVLVGQPATAAVNAPVPDGPEAAKLVPFIELAYRIGKLYPQLSRETTLPALALAMQGEIAELAAEPPVTAFLSGLLQTTTDRRVSVVNAESIAHELGVHVDVRRDAHANAFAASLRMTGGSTSITGTIVNGTPRIVELNGFEIDATPIGTLVITRHRDVPGMIGRVGTALGNANVNISTMQVSRNEIGGDAIMVLQVDRPVDEATLDTLRGVSGIATVISINL